MSRRRRATGDTLKRFWSYVDRTAGCWLWTGRRNHDGYGAFDADGRIHLAHRLSLEWALGEPLGDRFACHRCDTPACVRPDHLFAGTHQDNMADALAKGSMRRQSCPRGHNYDENAYVYNGKRRCRICYLEWQNRRRAERREAA